MPIKNVRETKLSEISATDSLKANKIFFSECDFLSDINIFSNNCYFENCGFYYKAKVFAYGGSYFENCMFENCKFLYLKMDSIRFENCGFKNCKFSDSAFLNCRIRKSVFYRCSFSNVDFPFTVLSEVCFLLTNIGDHNNGLKNINRRSSIECNLEMIVHLTMQKHIFMDDKYIMPSFTFLKEEQKPIIVDYFKNAKNMMLIDKNVYVVSKEVLK